MNLPASYYDGRNNPPHFDIWVKYFLKIFGLYASKVVKVALQETSYINDERIRHLSKKAKSFLEYLKMKNIKEFSPIDLSKELKVTNRTIINWALELSNNGFLKPIIVNKRIRYYEVI